MPKGRAVAVEAIIGNPRMGALALARSGRKRKTGYRKPSGDVRLQKENTFAVVHAQPHRRWLDPALRSDSRAESPLGVLHLQRKLTADQYLAATTYAAVVARYRAVIMAPNPHPRSSAGHTSEPRGGDPLEITPEEAGRRRDRYNAAWQVVWDFGQPAAKLVARVVVQGKPCAEDELSTLLRILNALAAHFGLTSGRKSGGVGNRL